MRLDAHQHFWTLARRDYAWLTPEFPAIYRDFGPGDLEPLLWRNGVEGTIAVQAAPSVAETEYLLSLADDHEWIRGVVGWIDFEADDAIAQLTYLARNTKLVGIRPMLENMPRSDWIRDAARAPVLAAMSDRGLALDALVRPAHLEHIVAVADSLPDLTIVIDHAGKPTIGDREGFAHWARSIAAAADRPNVACKLSGLLSEAPVDTPIEVVQDYVDVLIARFGPERLIWGSDWPVLLVAAGYDEWVAASQTLLNALDAVEQDAVFGENACRTYGLTSESNC